MKIRDIFKNNDVKTLETKTYSKAEKKQKNPSPVAILQGEDTVNISPISRKLATISKVVKKDSIKEEERIEDLKKRINEGSYDISLDKISEAFLDNIDSGVLFRR